MRYNLPDERGYFGQFGGRYVPETLMGSLAELEKKYLTLKFEHSFKEELKGYLFEFAGRPSPLYFAKNLTKKIGGAKKILYY